MHQNQTYEILKYMKFCLYNYRVYKSSILWYFKIIYELILLSHNKNIINLYFDQNADMFHFGAIMRFIRTEPRELKFKQTSTYINIQA